jgi:two-component system sensor histidine kinase YcbA
MMTVALFGQIYFYPFQSTFRFSAGVIALGLILLIRDDLSKIRISILSAMAILFLRSVITLYTTELPLDVVLSNNLPASFYYVVFGVLAYAMKLQARNEQAWKTLATLALMDISSNLVEAWIGGTFTNKLLTFIIAIGIARSLLVYFIYFLYRSQEILIMKREHQKRYAQLNAVISNIQAEMFYLKKSMGDIEAVMSKSHKLYDTYKDNDSLKEATLTIARDVHEIKKDYYRVYRGFESFLKTFEDAGSMSLRDIAAIIEENARRSLIEGHKNIQLEVSVFQSYNIKRYYSVFTLINNLIVNAIDACGENGAILVELTTDGDNAIFKVSDNGEGIEEELLPIIFTPGFTTKFDDSTGASSTGIGLAHVQNILNELDGHMNIETIVGKGTTFILTIPRKSLEG